jgi:amphi-Trp domain-containing protein
MSNENERDIERIVDKESFVKTLRRAADAIEKGEGFRIQIAGERFTIPANAVYSVEHEREQEDGKTVEEVELQFRWTV